ncbi:MAG: hypothetical protein COB17_00865 [Sulfurimonas sp.]|nr:MAG: hypothetical protein COB17_00865 [Sulfurimonas sp.]
MLNCMPGKEPTALSTAETKVETELTAEQILDTKIEQQFGDIALIGRKTIRAITAKLIKGEKELVLNTSSLGYKLVEIYKGFPTELKKSFWKIVDTEYPSKKTLERAIELVIEQGVKLSKAMDTSGGELDILENEKLLVLDKKVLKLYKDNLKVNKPTIIKINNMKGLSISSWELVCSGSDKPYTEYMDKEKETAADKKAKLLLAKKPKSMDKDTYLGYTKAEQITLIKEIADNGLEIANLKEKVKLLEQLVDKTPILGKNYTVAKTESEVA